MVERRTIIPEGMQEMYDSLHYAPGVLVGRTLYISGQIGRDESLHVVEDKEAQFVQVFENIRKVLDAAGAGFQDVVDVTSFHTDLRDLPLYTEVRDRYFTGNYPAWTALGVSMIGGRPGFHLEIRAIAELPE